MESNFFARRIKALFPIAALVVVAIVAVTTAMTILANTQPEAPTASPSAAATPTLADTGPPLDLATPSETPSPVMTVPLPATAPVILTIYEGAHDPNRVWFVVWRYPRFQPGSTPLAGLMNQDIVDEINTRIEVFESGPAAFRQLPGKANTLTGSFTTNMVSFDLVSLTLKWVDDTVPGHTLTKVETVNYALASGQRLDLEQLFGDMPAAMAIISAQSQEQLRRSLGSRYDPVLASGGTAPAVSNYGNWALTPGGLKVIFDQSQVGPDAAGMPIIVIPWSSLKSVIRPDGPAARLAGLPAPSAS